LALCIIRIWEVLDLWYIPFMIVLQRDFIVHLWIENNDSLFNDTQKHILLFLSCTLQWLSVSLRVPSLPSDLECGSCDNSSSYSQGSMLVNLKTSFCRQICFFDPYFSNFFFASVCRFLVYFCLNMTGFSCYLCFIHYLALLWAWNVCCCNYIW
jgi:hypothetical protein